MESLKEIVDDIKPTLICLAETHLSDTGGSWKLAITELAITEGGVAKAVRNKIKNITVEVYNSS